MKNPFKKNKEPLFLFDEKENTACFTCSHITDESLPILYVTHDTDGDWQFLCGQENHDESNVKVISIKQAVVIDETINNLFEMPLGVGAERKSKKDHWKPFKLSIKE